MEFDHGSGLGVEILRAFSFAGSQRGLLRLELFGAPRTVRAGMCCELLVRMNLLIKGGGNATLICLTPT